jgi:hypothetical protein
MLSANRGILVIKGTFILPHSGKLSADERQSCDTIPIKIINIFSCVLEVRPARRTDASAPLSAGAASPNPPPPLLAWGGESLLHLSPPVKETVQ